MFTPRRAPRRTAAVITKLERTNNANAYGLGASIIVTVMTADGEEFSFTVPVALASNNTVGDVLYIEDARDE